MKRVNLKNINLKASFKQNRIKLFIILILVGFMSAFSQAGKNSKTDEKTVDSLEKKDHIPLINKADDWRVIIKSQKQILKSLQDQLNATIDSFKGSTAERKVITKYIRVYVAYDSSLLKADTLGTIYYDHPKVSLIKKIFTRHKH
jgi:hypothetical protein